MSSQAALGKLLTSIIFWDDVPACLSCIARCSDEDIGRQTPIEPVCDPGDGVQCEICADWHYADGLILSDGEQRRSQHAKQAAEEDDGSCGTCGGSGGGDYGGIQCLSCHGSGQRPGPHYLRDDPDDYHRDDDYDDAASDAAADRYERYLGL